MVIMGCKVVEISALSSGIVAVYRKFLKRYCKWHISIKYEVVTAAGIDTALFFDSSG